ncbi:MAG: hypothetical protein H0W06_01735 [Chloroflexia bacterium]|nr:hypothetical protein [Chloroflexia bacterium]
MREVCICGRYGDVEDRDPVPGPVGDIGLKCPNCDHIDDLGWLAAREQAAIWAEVRRRYEANAKLVLRT